MVTFAGRNGDGLNLELSSEAGHLQVKVAKANADLAELLLKSHIRVSGICHGVHSSNGGEIMSSVSTPDEKGLMVLQLPLETWRRYPLQKISDLAEVSQNAAGRIIRLRGSLSEAGKPGVFQLRDSSGEVEIQPNLSGTAPIGDEMEFLGTLTRAGTNLIFLSDATRETSNQKKKTTAQQVLTTTEQIRWLKPEEAARRYPVKVRVVVTFVLGEGDGTSGNIQDGTGGIYAWHLVSSNPGHAVKPGDYCEVEGDSSAGEFSPGIYCHRLRILGRGEFPEPVRPTWDELASGSLDAQWVEVEGMVLSATNQHLEIGTQGGQIVCFIPGSEPLDRFVNAVVRVRGVVVADWDQARHVQGLHLNLPSEAFVSLETPPPSDPFSLPVRAIKELLFYDPGESAFRREKVLGQIVGIRDGVCYLSDGTNGLRLNPKDDHRLVVGDTVEAVGFPEIDSSTEPPVIALREAVLKLTGRRPLPPARQIGPVNLLDSGHDSTRVYLDAELVHASTYGTDQILELEAGARTFFARLNTSAGTIPSLPDGSRVEVTGVYLFNNGKANGRVEAGPFELLLNSPSDVRVLALPSWWTAEHTLLVVSGMGVIILLGLVWIAMLRQQVGRRTAQLSKANLSLEAEIAERKRTENELVQTRLQHVVERERTRIARDIHDELGSSLSQIRLLSEMSLSQKGGVAGSHFHADKISAKALEATHVLDEIVWAVDPHNDTLESLLGYLFNFASDFLSLAGIRFRIDAPARIPHHVLATHVRHQLYMAIKETLTNIVNHARATEVWIRVRLEPGCVSFGVEDNGRGFNLSAANGSSPGASGLGNMRKRFHEIGGDFILESAPDRGTRVKFILPLTGGTGLAGEQKTTGAAQP